MPKIKKGRDKMDFLKSLFEAGALTWEQFSEAVKKAGFEAVKKAGFEVVNAAGGAYVPKADLDAKQHPLRVSAKAAARAGLAPVPGRETGRGADGADAEP